MNEKNIFRFVDIGEGLHEGVIQEIKVKVGDKVQEGDSLLSVQTDKVASDLYAPHDGTILSISITEGQTVHVGDQLMYIGDANEKIEQAPTQSAPAQVAAPVAKVETKEEPKEQDGGNEGQSVVGKVVVSNKLMSTFGDQNSGDKNYVEQNFATPLARKTANDLKINLSQIYGSGVDGRIIYDDVILFQRNKLANAINDFEKQANSKNKLAIVVNPNDEVKGLTKIRKETAKAMMNSHVNVADTTLFFELDITDLIELRNQVKVAFQVKNEANLTYLAFFIQATALALKKYPIFNAVYEPINEELIYRHDVNMGIAVDTNDGLLVPNIKNADHLSLANIAQEITRLAKAARDKKLSLKDIKDGTFTITNLGSTGAIYGQPIVFYPQVAILGLGGIEEKLYLNKQKEVKQKSVIYFSITADHRWIDGADIARFANYIKQLFESKYYERELKNVY